MAIQHLTSTNFEDKVLKASKPVLVDFYAQWCGPCQMAAPILDAFSQEFKAKINIYKVDIDEDRNLSEKYSIQSIPTLIVFKNGKEADRKIGFPGEQGLRELVEKL
ncbi:thioredoxin [Candidatus Beckwithbacteria bacterium]|nr:thioredoxin [Candidatus Beckwithbacteria bacterium]